MKKILLVLLVCYNFELFSQIIPQSAIPGNNPVDVNWQSIDSKAVKVIFPKGNERQAMRLANIINLMSDSLGISVGNKRKHLNMLMQTNQVISNGYVALAPYRSELYATPVQNLDLLGSMDWLDVLALHEYRHAMQMANTRRGLTKFVYFLGGEYFWAFAQNIAVPNWYFEGDAVHNETLLSGAGRGRTPFFFQEQRALLLSNHNYRYMKARNGSYRSLMPDHYRLGYAIMHQVRNEKGPEASAKILRHGSSYRGVIYSFSKGMKRHYGYSTRKAYKRAYDTLRVNWEKELATLQLIPTTPVTKQPKRIVTNYEWPHYLDDGSIVCYKVSFNRTPWVVKLKDGKEEYLFTMGNAVTESFISVNDGMVAWTEYSTDPRWLYRNYSNIHSYDLQTKKRKTITCHSKLFSPEYSEKRKAFVAVKADEKLQNNIVFVSPETGLITDSIPNPENSFLSFPKWTKDANAIVYLEKKNNKIAMLKYDLQTKQTTELTPFSQQLIEGMSIGKEVVYFSASFSGIDNIYAVSLNGDKQIRQITSVKVGALKPGISPDEKTLIMSELTYMGAGLQTQPVDLASARVIQVVEPAAQDRYRISTTPVESPVWERIPQKTFDVKNYSGPIRGAKLHSWSFSANTTEVKIGVKINNVLNDFGADVTVGRNLNENVNFFQARFDFSKYYLPLSLLATNNGREIIEPTNLTDTGSYSKRSIQFKESILGGGLLLPLTWYQGIYSTSLKVFANAGYVITNKFEVHNDEDNDSINELNNTLYFSGIEKKLTIVEGGFNFNWLRATAKQNLAPRTGVTVNMYMGSSVSSESAMKFQTYSAIYLPGFMRNHSLKLEGGYKKEELTNSYRFLDDFKHARGYTPIQGDEEIVYSANYSLPLCYPDFGINGIIYFKRIRSTLFADFSQVKRNAMNKTFDQNSMGVELVGDVVILNILPVGLGVRYSALSNTHYYEKDKKSTIEFFFGAAF